MEGQNKKVLIVEDEADMAQMLASEFKKSGLETLSASNGEDGLQLANKEHPGLIILDIIMPKMDGIEMLKRLRSQDDWGKNVSVILLTNISEKEKMAEALEIGIDEYIVKSDWKIKDIVEKAKSILSIF